MEDAVNQLVRFFLGDGEPLKGKSEDSVLCHAVIYEDIQSLVRMKMDYEAVRYFRRVQSFDENYPQKVGLVWLGNYRGRDWR